jgi:hypothetical protein
LATPTGQVLPATVPVVAVFTDGARRPVVAWSVLDGNEGSHAVFPVLVGFVVLPAAYPDVYPVSVYDTFDHYEYGSE